MIKTKINNIIEFKMLISLINLIFISFLTLKLIDGIIIKNIY